MRRAPALHLDAERFWSRIDKSGGESACWPWRGAQDRVGYGQITVRANGCVTSKRAHRHAYELAKGTIPAGTCLMHSCDNRRCCNPAHLSVGTHGDNMRDAARKGRLRQLHGADNPRAVLTPAIAAEIRSLRFDGRELKDIAARFGFCVTTVLKVVKNRSYV